MLELFSDLRPFVVAALAIFLAVATSAHVVLFKRDDRAAVGWVGVVLLFPILGPVLYAVFGINRITRRASVLRQDRRWLEVTTAELRIEHRGIEQVLPPGNEHLVALGRLVDRVTHIPMTADLKVQSDKHNHPWRRRRAFARGS